MIFSDSPYYIHTNSYVCGSYFSVWWLHRDPWWPCDYINIIKCLSSTQFFEGTAPLHSPFRQSLPMPSLTSRSPSHRTAHTRSPGPQLICTTSPGTDTSSQTEPSGLWWLMPLRNHTYPKRDCPQWQTPSGLLSDLPTTTSDVIKRVRKRPSLLWGELLSHIKFKDTQR